MNPDLLTRYRWMKAQGESASNALALARAEAWLTSQPALEFRWETDPEPDWSWLGPATRRRYERTGWPEVEGCALWRQCPACGSWQPNYDVALWGIVDADAPYRRWLEAQLALEAWRARLQPGQCSHQQAS